MFMRNSSKQGPRRDSGSEWTKKYLNISKMTQKQISRKICMRKCDSTTISLKSCVVVDVFLETP